MEKFIVFAVLGVTLGLFIWGRIRYDLVAVAALILLTVIGIVPASEAFHGFGHPAVITVAAVLVIGRAVRDSGIIELAAKRIARLATSPVLHVALLSGLVAACSAVMNNVAALALLIPMAIRTAEENDRPVSQVLMPLSFGSLLGGLTTLMGTPPNIIIATFRGEIAGAPFGVFDFTPVGLSVAVVGIAYLALAGWRLLPQRRQCSEQQGQLFEVSDYISEVRIPEGSPFVGKPLRALYERARIDFNVVGLIRRDSRILAPLLSETFKADDLLIVECDPASLQTIAQLAKLEILGDAQFGRERLQSENVTLVEAVVSPGSWLEDRSANSLRFRERFGANLLAISRRGRPVWSGLSGLRIRPGDVLLLQGRKDTLPAALRNLGCLPLAERQVAPAKGGATIAPIGIFLGAIAFAAAGLVQVHVAFVAAALLIVLFGFLSPREAYESIEWPIVVLIGALLPIGEALKETGGTELIAQNFMSVGGELPLVIIVALLVALSMLLSDVINNAAAALVMAPVAGSLANSLGIGPDALLMAVAIGCSCTFLTPIGHQSNTLVWGPGGYRFSDYARMGLPLNALIIIVATLTIQAFWIR